MIGALARVSPVLSDGRLKTSVQARLDRVSRLRRDGLVKGARVPVQGGGGDA